MVSSLHCRTCYRCDPGLEHESAGFATVPLEQTTIEKQNLNLRYVFCYEFDSSYCLDH